MLSDVKILLAFAFTESVGSSLLLINLILAARRDG